MLLKFSFKNFKSFRNEATLDLTATKITEHSERNFEVGNVKVLPVACIIGANASGKSNVMEAFRFMQGYVRTSLMYLNSSMNMSYEVSDVIKPMPFFFDKESKNKGSKFEIIFSLNGDEKERVFEYGFVNNNNTIEEEWLKYKSKTSRDEAKNIFSRRFNKIENNGLKKEIIRNIETSLRPEVLVVSLGAQLNEPLLKEIMNWFYNSQTINFGDPEENSYIASGRPFAGTLLNKKVQEDVVKYLSSFDDTIKGIKVYENKGINPNHKGTIEVSFYHRIIGTDEEQELPMEFESSGTRKMLDLYYFFKEIIKRGGVLIIDELNSRLHPLLIRNILQIFTNKTINKNNAQLIFTSHDIWQLKSDILRRDEIWFTEKDKDGASTLYSLSDFVDGNGDKIRKDEDYQKNYILGKYGAIPKLKGFDGVI